MGNRFTVNLFIDKGNNISKINFSIELDDYDREIIESKIKNKLDLDEEKWIISNSNELEYIEKERVIFWKVKLNKVK